MIDPRAAWQIIMDRAIPLRTESIPLDRCLHRYLAEPIIADRDIPPANRAAMDGYAVRASDTTSAPVVLRIVGEVAAGSPEAPPVAPGECVRILTGGNIPPDTDAVVRVEDAAESADGTVTIRKKVESGADVLRQGECALKGNCLIPEGALIRAVTVGVCAMVGYERLRVHARPKVAVVTTGSELKPVGARVAAHEIRDANGAMLMAALSEFGFAPAIGDRVPDDRERLQSTVRAALTECEVVVLSGGVSVGKYDFVPSVLQEVGAVIHFHGVAIKPGRPILFATVGNNRCIFGLPGNPVSALIGFHEFVLPALRRLAGCPVAGCRINFRLPLHSPIKIKVSRQLQYLPARLVHKESNTAVEAIPTTGAADLVAAGRADGTIIVPVGISSLSPGTIVDFRPWRPV